MSEEQDNRAIGDPPQSSGWMYAQASPPPEGDPPPSTEDDLDDGAPNPEGDPPPNAPSGGGLEGDPPPN